jgi:hypothetical protein
MAMACDLRLIVNRYLAESEQRDGDQTELDKRARRVAVTSKRGRKLSDGVTAASAGVEKWRALFDVDCLCSMIVKCSRKGYRRSGVVSI